MQHGAQHDMLGFGLGSRGIRQADIESIEATALTWASCLLTLIAAASAAKLAAGRRLLLPPPLLLLGSPLRRPKRHRARGT